MSLFGLIETIQSDGYARFNISHDQILKFIEFSEQSRVQARREVSPGLEKSPDYIQFTLERNAEIEKLAPYRTRFEDKEIHFEAMGHWKRLSAFPEANGIKAPLIATTLSGVVNAFAIAGENSGDFAIVMDRSLYSTFANLLAKILARAVTSMDGEDIEINLGESSIASAVEREPDLNKRFSDLFLAYMFDGSPSAAPQYYPDPSLVRATSLIREGFQLFIIGHELGHAASGHFDDPLMMGHSAYELTRMIDDKTPCFIHRHRNEIEADRFSLTLIIRTALQLGPIGGLILLGAVSFFAALDTCERILYFVATGTDVMEDFATATAFLTRGTLLPTTHPSPNMRLHLMREMIEGLDLPKEIKNTYSGIIGGVQMLMWKGFEQLVPSLIRYKNEGRTLDSYWLDQINELAVIQEFAIEIANYGKAE